MKRSLLLGLVSAACIPTPTPAGLSGSESAMPYEPTAPYYPGDTDTTSGTTDGTTADGTDSGATETGEVPATSSGGSTGGDVDSTTSGGSTGSPPVGEFEPAEPFGDDIVESDLIGVWGSPWDPAGVADVTLTIAGDGTFEWRETSADCAVDKRATGQLWVEATQLVMHVESWDKRMPWDTQAVLALNVSTPFRLRIGYSPMGGYLGLAGPRRMTDVRDWQGRSYDRIDPGTGPQGRWIAESELWALVDGGPALIVRERFSADLLGGNSATLTRERSWWWPGPDPVHDEPGVQSSTWLDQTPGNIAGAATVAGTMHAYDAVHMFTFVSDQALKLGVASDC